MGDLNIVKDITIGIVRKHGRNYKKAWCFQNLNGPKENYNRRILSHEKNKFHLDFMLWILNL